MASAVKILPHYTFEDWCSWEGQWELIYGLPFAMSPSAVLKHQRVGGNLFSEFRLALRACNKKCRAYQPVDYRITNDTILQPDMVIVCGHKETKYLETTPALVAEVLSPSTALKDRHTKFDIYQSEKIPYYLIIDIEDESVEVYQLVADAYELKGKGREVAFTFELADCTAPIDFKDIWD